MGREKATRSGVVAPFTGTVGIIASTFGVDPVYCMCAIYIGAYECTQRFSRVFFPPKGSRGVLYEYAYVAQRGVRRREFFYAA